MAFKLASDGGTAGNEWIVADGEIARDTAQQFRQFLTDRGIPRGARYEVYLNSLGGNLLAGLQFGEVIREHGFGTRVARSVPLNVGQPGRFETDAPGVCYSACSFAFIGGKWRIAPDRSIGVHQHYVADALADPRAKRFSAEEFSAQQIVNGLLADFVVRMGVDARFLSLASVTGPTEIYRFSAEELTRYSIVWDDLAYSEWVLEPYREGVIAVSRTRNGDHAVSLFCRVDRALRFLLISPRRSAVTAEEIVAGAKVFVFGHEIKKEDIQGKTLRDKLHFEIKLPAGLKPDNPATGIGAVGTLRSFFYQNVPERNFTPMSRVVARNCY
jgi:hypothetical protein